MKLPDSNTVRVQLTTDTIKRAPLKCAVNTQKRSIDAALERGQELDRWKVQTTKQEPVRAETECRNPPLGRKQRYKKTRLHE